MLGLGQNLDYAEGRARPLHRQPRLGRPEVLRALVEARGSQEGRLHQRRRRLDRALPGHPAVRHRQGVDDDQHDARPAERAGEGRRGRTSATWSCRRSAPARWPASRRRTPRASASRRRPRTRDRPRRSSSTCSRQSACRPMWTTSKQIPAAAGFDSSSIDDALHQERLRHLGRRRQERLRRRPHADPLLDRRHVRRLPEDPRRHDDRRGGRHAGQARSPRSGRSRTPTGRELHDLGS